MAKDFSAHKPLTPRQREWLGHLRAWRERGGSLKAYALAHELSLSGLYTARRSLTQRGVWQRGAGPAPGAGSTPTLVPVRLLPGPSLFRVLLPNGIVVEVPEQADPERCRALLACVTQALQ